MSIILLQLVSSYSKVLNTFSLSHLLLATLQMHTSYNFGHHFPADIELLSLDKNFRWLLYKPSRSFLCIFLTCPLQCKIQMLIEFDIVINLGVEQHDTTQIHKKTTGFLDLPSEEHRFTVGTKIQLIS